MTEEVSTRDRIFWLLGIVIVIFYAIFPVLWIVSLSLKSPDTLAVQEGAGFWSTLVPESATFDNYTALFDNGLDGPFLKPLINSIGIALIATVIAIVLASFAAYAIARLEFPGKTAVLAGALAIAMVPPISTIGPLFDMGRTLGLYDTWLGLIIPYLTFALPLSVYILVSFFKEIPRDLEEAALVDGATHFQAFRKVVVPLAAPGLATAGILTFIGAWNEFLLAVTLTSSSKARTVPAAIAFFTGATEHEVPFGSISAASVVISVPLILLVLFFQKRIVAGLTAGAVKG